jgi:hypothetical protein
VLTQLSIEPADRRREGGAVGDIGGDVLVGGVLVASF